MSEQAFLKTWTGAALAYVVLVAILFGRTTMGSEPSLLFGFVTVSANSVPAIGVPVDLVTGIVMLLLTLHWSRKQLNHPWPVRIPVYHFSRPDIHDGLRLGKLFKGLTFVVVHVVTLAATIQMVLRYLNEAVYVRDGPIVVSGGLAHFDYAKLKAAQSKAMLNFGDPVAPETFAVLPWLWTAFAVGYFVLWVWVCWTIFAPTKGGKPPAERLTFPTLDA